MSSSQKTGAQTAPPVPTANAPIDEWIAFLRTKVESLSYGSIQIVVHDGRITLVESTEKVRPTPIKSTPPASSAKTE